MKYVFFSFSNNIFSQLVFFNISTDIKIAQLPYFSLEIPAKIFGHAEVGGVITVWIHLISLSSEGFTAVFRWPALLHDPPRFVFFLWWNRNHRSDGDETKTNCYISPKTTLHALFSTHMHWWHTNFDYQNWFYPPHINQAVDDDRAWCCDHVQHSWVFWMMCFPTKQQRSKM